MSIFGRELISTTWKPCKMNLAIRGLEGNIGKNRADAFHNDVWSKYGFQIFCNQIKVSHEKWEELFWK
ncbi:hypothetical protein GCM10007096_17100 [Pullulanibacillus pueri]|uniref:DNA methylase adenine-specific domain-containing protein n=1 Tax=Pullulanibacillus pueri TaxID=1437324 RepID=A0A8J3ELZ0_9BACL|nr:hypothetical protein GCM10007096_17100 [Pullulanibacillus pueri]